MTPKQTKYLFYINAGLEIGFLSIGTYGLIMEQYAFMIPYAVGTLLTFIFAALVMLILYYGQRNSARRQFAINLWESWQEVTRMHGGELQRYTYDTVVTAWGFFMCGLAYKPAGYFWAAMAVITLLTTALQYMRYIYLQRNMTEIVLSRTINPANDFRA